MDFDLLGDILSVFMALFARCLWILFFRVSNQLMNVRLATCIVFFLRENFLIIYNLKKKSQFVRFIIEMAGKTLILPWLQRFFMILILNKWNLI